MSVKTIFLRTDASGDYTYERNFKGRIYALEFVVGDLSTPDIDVTDDTYSKTFLSVDGVSSDTVYPIGTALVTSAGAAVDALSTGDTVGVYGPAICMGVLKVVISGGGDTKKGRLNVLYDA